MKIAIVNSDGPQCPECGQREPVLIAAYQTPIEEDIGPIIERQWDIREAALHAGYAQERALAEQAIRAAGEPLARLLDALLAEFEPKAPRWRWLKAWRQRRLERRFAAVIREATS